MQEREREQADQPLPTSQPLTPAATVQPIEQDDDPDDIFLNAVAEIDTQPLVKVKRRRAETALNLGDVLEILYLVCWACFALFGSMHLAATVPHTLVIVYAKSYPAQITATLDVPTRPLAPVTVTRSQTAPTTGHGYQEARAATGLLTVFNGSFSPQRLPIGTLLTGSDGVKVATGEAATVPAAQPPQFAQVQVTASAVTAGSTTNIAAGDITLALTGDLLVKNLTAFTGGRDARTYRAVAPQDVTLLTSTVHEEARQALITAFLVQHGEEAVPTACHETMTATHAVREEAGSLTVTTVQTCAAVAYKSQDLHQQATIAFTQTKPAASYHVVGSVQKTIESITPFTVAIRGTWVYTFSTEDEQSLAAQVAGDTPAQAKMLLLKTGVIADASIPDKLPPDGSLIDFLVLVG